MIPRSVQSVYEYLDLSCLCLFVWLLHAAHCGMHVFFFLVFACSALCHLAQGVACSAPVSLSPVGVPMAAHITAFGSRGI